MTATGDATRPFECGGKISFRSEVGSGSGEGDEGDGDGIDLGWN